MQIKSILWGSDAEKRKGVSPVEKVTTFPSSRSGIVNFVQDHGTNMIVMGTPARKGLPRCFFGSVAEAMIEEAPWPL